MKKPSVPKDEKARLSALRELKILDTPAEEQFDNITELAAYICDMPVALITLIDKDRQWYKSKVGIGQYELPRNQSFCAHAILSDRELMEIPDARHDERFKDNPLTTAKNKPVIFYAGCPLRDADGHGLGSLCLIDHKPRRLNPGQKKALKTLGNQVERLFELRLKNNELQKSRKKLKQHNNLLKEFAGAVSHDLKMPLANTIVTIDVLKGKYADKLDEQAMDYLARLKQSAFGMSDYISMILEYYETDTISADDYPKKPFSLKGFLDSIVDMLNIETDCKIQLPKQDIGLVCNRSGLEQILLNLLGNSLKYNDKDKIRIAINCEENDGFYQFVITDNGMGIPEKEQGKIFDLFKIAADRDRHGKKGNGIGLSAVKKLVQNLGGHISISSKVGEYTTVSFSIKKPKQQKTA